MESIMYILTNGIVAIGPFISAMEAEYYRTKVMTKESNQYKVMEILSPNN